MKNKILFLIVILLSVIEVISLKRSKTNFSLPKNKVIKINVKDTKNNKITEEELEEYIIGVVGAEMPASFDEEALKAQAVASRTYAVYKMNHSNQEYDVVTDISNQAYQSNDKLKEKWQEDYDYYYNKIKNAVLSTKDEVMQYDGEVIIAYYFAMSNGKTEDSSLVFNEQKPYLISKDSNWENSSLNNFTYTKEISLNEFKNLLNITEPITISNIIRSDTNRVLKITINNQEYSGTDIRKKLNLRSTDFKIDIKDNVVNITTNGYGHGVGMSQYGAQLMAKNGYSYQDILKYYYSNIEIVKL